MRCFLHLPLNVALGALAGFGMADAVTVHSLAPLYYEGSGVIGRHLGGRGGVSLSHGDCAVAQHRQSSA